MCEILDITHVYTYMQYICSCIFTCVYACMAIVASQLASYLPFILSCNATVVVTLFFPYRAWAAHQGVEDKIVEEVESRNLILQIATSYLMEAFLLPEVTVHTYALHKMLSKVPYGMEMCVNNTNTQHLCIAITQTTTLLRHACAANEMDLLSILHSCNRMVAACMHI